MNISEITHILYHTTNHSHEEQLAAIRQLQEAPPYDGPWNRALVMALGIPNYEIQQAALDSCLRRLNYLETLNERVQNNFLGSLIQFCLTERDRESEVIRASAMEKVAQKLERYPLRYAHHLRHLLSLAYDMLYITEQREVAQTTINILKRLADQKENRSDYLTIDKLYFHRRNVVYSDPSTQASVLYGFLEQDKQLTLVDLNRETFRAYRSLLTIHTGQDRLRETSIQAALGNLNNWLCLLPQTLESRTEHIINDVHKASQGADWKDLHSHLSLHLAAHVELLTGKDREDDLLRILTKYTHPNDQEILKTGLKVLACLPELRTRMEDITTLCNRLIQNQHAEPPFWREVFNLIGSLIVGLPESSPFTLPPNHENESEEERKRQVNRLNRLSEARRAMLQEDTKMRQFLYQFSHRKDIHQEIRLIAWRTLLLTLPSPEELTPYYQNGLSLATWSDPPKRAFFWETLRIATETYQRQAWDILMSHWSQLVAPAPDRKETVQKLADAFGRLRNYSAVKPLIALALDDDDCDIRQIAKRAIRTAGYSKELACEETRRHILKKNNEQTEICRQIIALEEERNHTVQQIGQKVDVINEISFEVQFRKQRYQSILTNAYLETAQLTIESQKINNALVVELKRAEQEENELHQLASKIQRELGKLQELESALANLNQRFQTSKEKIGDWQTKIRNLNRQIEELTAQIVSDTSAIPAMKNKIRSLKYELENNTPRKPPPTGEPEQDRRMEAQYKRDLDNFRQKKQGEIGQCDDAIKTYKRNMSKNEKIIKDNITAIKHNESCIIKEENELKTTHGDIKDIQRKQKQLEEERNKLNRQFSQKTRELDEIQQVISKLQAQYREIQHDNQKHQRETRRQLEQQQKEINGLRYKKEQVMAEINSFSHKRNDLTDQIQKLNIKAQRLHQDIESLWDYLHRISAEARQESALSEQNGRQLQEDTRRHVWNAQESLFWYAYEISQARRYQQPLKPAMRQRYEREAVNELAQA